MGQVARHKVKKEPPTKQRRIERFPRVFVDARADLVERFRAMASRASAWNVRVGVYAPARSTAVH